MVIEWDESFQTIPILQDILDVTWSHVTGKVRKLPKNTVLGKQLALRDTRVHNTASTNQTDLKSYF